MSRELSRSATGPSWQIVDGATGSAVMERTLTRRCRTDAAPPGGGPVLARSRTRRPARRRRRRARRGPRSPRRAAPARRGCGRRASRRRTPRAPTGRTAATRARRTGRAPRGSAARAGDRRRRPGRWLTTTMRLGRRPVREVLDGADEPLQPDGFARADDEEMVRLLERGEGRRVAPGRGGVVAQLLVVLEPEAAVDDDVVDQRTGQGEDVLDDGASHLGPPVGGRYAGEHPQARGDPWSEPGEAGDVEDAVLGRPSRRGQPGRLVDEGEGLCHARAVGVEVDEEGVDTGLAPAPPPGSSRRSSVPARRSDPTPP